MIAINADREIVIFPKQVNLEFFCCFCSTTEDGLLHCCWDAVHCRRPLSGLSVCHVFTVIFIFVPYSYRSLCVCVFGTPVGSSWWEWAELQRYYKGGASWWWSGDSFHRGARQEVSHRPSSSKHITTSPFICESSALKCSLGKWSEHNQIK